MSNPYQAPAQKAMDMSSGQFSGHPMQPLLNATGWMTFLGWLWIIGGAFYCLTLIGIIVGAPIIWMGVCLKNAGEKTKLGFPNNGQLLYEANQNLSTFFTILAVLALIGIVMTVLYLMFIIGVMVFGLTLGAASMQEL